MTNKITIRLHSQKVENGKQTFIASSSQINGIWYKIKFTRDCENQPKERGLYDLTIDIDNASIEAGKPYTNKTGKQVMGNDVIWVKAIESIRKLNEEELKQLNRDRFARISEDQTVPF